MLPAPPRVWVSESEDVSQQPAGCVPNCSIQSPMSVEDWANIVVFTRAAGCLSELSQA